MINNKNKKSKKIIKNKSNKRYIDILMICLIIGAAICLHLPSYRYNTVDKELIKEYEDENGDTYLHDMDSYYYVRKVIEISKDSRVLFSNNDTIRGEKNRSKHKIATPLAFPTLISVIWKVVSLFFKKIPFMRFIRFMGPILSSLACIPAYIFVKKRTNIFGGLIAGFTAAISPAFFDINGFGCFDTDLLLYLLPLLFMCSLIEAFQESSFKKQLIWIGLLSLGYIFLSYTWIYHTIYYYLAIGLSLLFIFITLIKEKFNFKKSLKYGEFRSSLIVIVVLTIITLLVDKTIDISLFSFLINIIKGNSAFLAGNYPDPGKYVSELVSIPIISGGIPLLLSGGEHGIVNKMGGIFIVGSSLITLIYFFKHGLNYITKNNEEEKNNYILFIVLTLWLIGGLICLTAGSRFTKISVIPISLILGLGISAFYTYLSKKGYGLCVILMAAGFIFFIPSIVALRQAKAQQPSVNDAIDDISNWVRKNTDSDAIIVSWWDYGYYYQYKGKRATVADGGTFNGRYYYWLANIFITKDEHLSSSISKMLAYSGVEASYLADEYAGSAKLGCEMLKEILVLNKDEAGDLLKKKYHLKDKQIKKLLKYSHARDNREVIVIVTKDMLTKIGPISYYAYYDFSDKEKKVTYVDNEFMMYKLYHDVNIGEYYEHLKKVDDPTLLNDGRIWKVIKKD